MHPRVFVVIPVHNGIEHTLPTVRALSALLHPQDRIVVVNDGSTDGTSEILRAEHPEIILLQGDGNLWWSGATNLGAQRALEGDADFVLFLNNDVVLHPQFLEELLLGAEEFPRSLIASKILAEEEPWKIWSMGGKVDWLAGRVWMQGCGRMDDGSWEEPLEADWLPGMSVLVPSRVFQEGLYLDRQAFPQYSGDSDFTMRARRRGYRLVVWPRSRVYNKVKNSGLDTKLLMGSERLTWRRFWETFTSIKSSRALRTYGRWVMRHGPFWSWPMMLGRFYLHHLLKCLQIWLQLPSPKSLLARKNFKASTSIPEAESQMMGKVPDSALMSREG